MMSFIRAKIVSPDLYLLLLSIVLSIIIYSSPSIVAGHMDMAGNINGSGSKGSIFVLPAVALFIFIVFNAFERNPSLLIKGDNADDPKTQESTLFYWRVLKLLSMCCMDAILIVTYFPKARFIMLLIMCLFLVYNLVFLFKAFQQSK